MRKLSQREKYLVVLVGVAVLIHFGWGWALRPVLRRWTDLHAQVTDLETELAQHQASLRQKRQVEQQYRAVGAITQQKGSDEEQIAQLLQTVTGTMKAHGVTDRGVRVYPVEEGSFYRRFRFRLELEGGVIPIAGFMDSLVRAKESFRVEEMVLRASGSYEVLRAVVLVSAITVLEPAIHLEGHG